MALGKASGTPMSGPRVLIARYSAIGDCVMAAPVPSRIRRSHPNSFLVWAIEDRCADVVDSERLIDVVAVDERTKWRRQGPRSWGPKLRFWLSLRKHKFDLGLDLQGYPKTALCLAFARPRRTVSVGGKDALSRMLVPSMKGYDPSLHIVERNLAALGELGEFPGDAAPILPEYRDIRDRLRQDWPADTPLASLSVGAGHSNKAYPAEKWAEVAQGLIARGFAVALLGGPEVQAPQIPGAIDYVGRLRLRESMAVVASSALHLAADTGSGHIAAGYGVPVVSLFGATPVARFRPYTDNGVVLEGEGSPATLDPSQVLQAATELWERNARAISH